MIANQREAMREIREMRRRIQNFSIQEKTKSTMASTEKQSQILKFKVASIQIKPYKTDNNLPIIVEQEEIGSPQGKIISRQNRIKDTVKLYSQQLTLNHHFEDQGKCSELENEKENGKENENGSQLQLISCQNETVETSETYEKININEPLEENKSPQKKSMRASEEMIKKHKEKSATNKNQIELKWSIASSKPKNQKKNFQIELNQFLLVNSIIVCMAFLMYVYKHFSNDKL